MQITATTEIELNNLIYSIEFENKFRLLIEEDWRFLAMKRERGESNYETRWELISISVFVIYIDSINYVVFIYKYRYLFAKMAQYHDFGKYAAKKYCFRT